MQILAVSTTVAIALLLTACGGDDEPAKAPSSSTAATSSSTTAAKSAGGCESTDAPAAKPDGDERAPRGRLERGATYDVAVSTNCGTFTIRLDTAAAPRTAASFVALARSGFFDDTIFHRIVPGFVIQGGDPTGTGTGGPGYKTTDTPPQDARYTQGVVAMAKTGTEAPGTAGSQFFVVTGPDAGLPPEYAVLGEVTKGIDVVTRIGNLGAPDEKPTEPVVIEGMRVRSS